MLAAYAAVRLGDIYAAINLYQRALEDLRKLLRTGHPTTNQTFLRIWSTVLIMAEYEAQLGHAEAQAIHLRGAMTLLSQAVERFSTDSRPPTNSSQSSPTLESYGTSEADDQESIVSVPRNEQDLPDLLARLTMRLSLLCPAYDKTDIRSYPFKNTSHEQEIILRQLRDMQTELYMLVIPLIEAFYSNSPTDQAAGVRAFRTLIKDYNDLLQTLIGDTEQVYTSCAEPNFPFSPIIMFLNPQMMQPHAVPHIFTVLMAPFVDEDEHETSLRYLSGISAGYVKIKGLRQDAAFPDLLISGYWRPGPEREYFMPEVERRKPDFQRVLKRIWHLCDMSEIVSAGKKLTKTEVLQISWREYKAAMKSGYDMATNTRNKHEGLYQLHQDV